MTTLTVSDMSMPVFARYPSLVGRAVLITGGASGIGATLVEQFVAQGARVVFIDLDPAAGEPRCAGLGRESPPPRFVAADLTDIGALDRAIDVLRGGIGPIAGLL